MRTTRAAWMVMILAAMVIAAACARDVAGTEAASSTTTTQPETLQDAMNLPRATAPAVEDEAQGGEEDEEDRPAPRPQGPIDSEPDVTLIDREALAEQVPDLATPRGCAELGTAYGRLHLLALDGGRGAAQAQEAARTLKVLLPLGLHDDLDVVVDAITAVASQGLVASGNPFEDASYNGANALLSSFFEDGCPG